MPLRINIQWDEESDVWIATSDDVRGLVLESASLVVLMARVKQVIPELLDQIDNAKEMRL